MYVRRFLKVQQNMYSFTPAPPVRFLRIRCTSINRFSQTQSTGPRAATPDAFVEALFNDNSSWAVTDRGPLEALVPVTRVLENTISLLGSRDTSKGPLEVLAAHVRILSIVHKKEDPLHSS